MAVPDEFWNGEQKLLWRAEHVEEIYQTFPTLHLSMATDENSSQEFCLEVGPQVHVYDIVDRIIMLFIIKLIMLGMYAIHKHTMISVSCLPDIKIPAIFSFAQLYLRQIDVQIGEADPAVCPATSPCDAFTFGIKPRALGNSALPRKQMAYC